MSFLSKIFRSSSFSPSAPSLRESYDQRGQTYRTSCPSNYSGQQQQQSYYGQGTSGGGGYSYGYSGFPPGTSPDIIRSFEMVDRDRSGFIDENELQQALSSGYQRFQIRTVRLLMFLFRNPHDPQRIGPKEFAALWTCLGQWRGIYERYDKDKSGKIDLFELRDALYSIGLATPSSVLQVLISKYDDGSGRKIELDFDSFVECGVILKGLTEKFKEKDERYTGTVSFNYDEFMSMAIPFLVSYD
ncbi:hypothetical protein SADUNF_Sadunf04G0144800 [Salix dunnii]|uniref:EF-hand domain-containing protein n=1 Tax=Salix dunnii TaxID=1413687 RepID=A0A835K7Q0_9ROSI|nr:hypothetical protein SADUNF_Sadunf04G0144800 [Salix dunnii]